MSQRVTLRRARLPEAIVQDLARKHAVHIAIRNGSSRFIVGGYDDALADMEAYCLSIGGQVVPLPVAVASHTPLMAEAALAFRRALEVTEFRDPRIAVLGGTTALPVRTRHEAINGLVDQIHGTIDWSGCMTALVERGHSAILELLPGAQLSKMLGAHDGAPQTRAIADFRTLEGVRTWLLRH